MYPATSVDLNNVHYHNGPNFSRPIRQMPRDSPIFFVNTTSHIMKVYVKASSRKEMTTRKHAS